jgi:hypothetical protein
MSPRTPRSEAILPGPEEAVQRRGHRPVAAPRGGCALRSKNAPNILFGPLGIMIPYRRTSIQNGGSARGYQRVSAASAAQQSRLRSNRTDSRTVYLYIAEFGVNVLNCRGQGQALRPRPRRGGQHAPKRTSRSRREAKVGRLDMGACQLEGSSGQRVTGVTTMPTPGTATK